MAWKNNIESTPDVLHGKPRIKGTRIPVSLILGYLACNKNEKDIMTDYPEISSADILACLEFAKELSETESIVV